MYVNKKKADRKGRQKEMERGLCDQTIGKDYTFYAVDNEIRTIKHVSEKQMVKRSIILS